jgi:hypothetical protein
MCLEYAKDGRFISFLVVQNGQRMCRLENIARNIFMWVKKKVHHFYRTAPPIDLEKAAIGKNVE